MHTIVRAGVLSLRSSVRATVLAAPRAHLSFARTGTDAPFVSEISASRSRLHTSSRSLAPVSSKPSHNADTYSKDVDTSAPASTKTYEVDADGSASRPNELLNQTPPTSQPLSSSSASSSSKKGEGKHTAESYFKDVDSSPPSSSKTYEVDADGSAARPNEQYDHPDKEYANVSKEDPYAQNVEKNNGEKKEQKEQRLGYGGTGKDAERDAPKRGEGPDGGDAAGRGA